MRLSTRVSIHIALFFCLFFCHQARADESDLVWGTFLGGSASDECHGIVLDQKRQVSVSGWTHSSDFPTTPGSFCPVHSGQYSDAFLTILDSSGSMLKYGTFLGGGGIGLGWALAGDDDGFFYLTGETKSADFPTTAGAFCDTITGDYADIFVCKLSPGATFAPDQSRAGCRPEASALVQNWPNPFNARTRIRYRTLQEGYVTVRIFNIMGQQVRELVNGDRGVGEHAVDWDGKNDIGHRVSSGVYLCRMQTKGVAETIKMVLLS